MRKIYLSIGSNKGNRYSFIKEALRLIRKDIGKVVLMSKIYETKSWGFHSDDFLNICIMIKSELLFPILDYILEILFCIRLMILQAISFIPFC